LYIYIELLFPFLKSSAIFIIVANKKEGIKFTNAMMHKTPEKFSMPKPVLNPLCVIIPISLAVRLKEQLSLQLYLVSKKFLCFY
jgi:hypothetical protein